MLLFLLPVIRAAEFTPSVDLPSSSDPRQIPRLRNSPAAWWKSGPVLSSSSPSDQEVIDQIAMRIFHEDEEKQARIMAQIRECVQSKPLQDSKGLYASILVADKSHGYKTVVSEFPRMTLPQARATECAHMVVKDMLGIPHLLATYQGPKSFSLELEQIQGITWREWLRKDGTLVLKPFMVAQLVLMVAQLHQHFRLAIGSALYLDKLWVNGDQVFLEDLSRVNVEPTAEDLAADWFVLGTMLSRFDSGHGAHDPVKTLIKGLCMSDHAHRWGTSMATFVQILSHPYFEFVDWSALLI